MFRIGQSVELFPEGGRNCGCGVITGGPNCNQRYEVKMYGELCYYDPEQLRPVTRPSAAERNALDAMKRYAPYIANSDAYKRGWRIFLCVDRTARGTEFNNVALPLDTQPMHGDFVEGGTIIGLFGDYYCPKTGLRLYAARCGELPRVKATPRA